MLKPSGSISGAVKNGAGVGIANVTVQAYDTNGYFVSGATTGSNGGYTVSSLAAGSYKVRFNASSGYVSEWYNGKATYNAADPVVVTLSQLPQGSTPCWNWGRVSPARLRMNRGSG